MTHRAFATELVNGRQVDDEPVILVTARLTSNAVSSFCGRELSGNRPRSGRSSSEIRSRLGRFLSGIGQPAELIAVACRFLQRLLSATRRDASGTPLLFLPQTVAFGPCLPVGGLLFLPLLDHGPSQLRLEVAHALVRAVDHGQFAAGDVIEQATPGR